jgi:uroporphyrinogen decarboxylase
MHDCPDIIHRQIDYRYEKVVQAIERSDLPEGIRIVNEGCDIAFKTGLLFPPSFLQRSLIPGLARMCDAVHRKGRKVLFHSDGNLWDILDDLVSAGIDLLHPLEPLAGMDPERIHQRYPHLILCGTIDVSQLLPYGTEQEIKDQVVRNIETTEGRIMVGSSTEVHNEVPLRNYLALYEAVLDYAY